MYDVALTLRDSIISLDRSRHPHVSYQPDWGKSFYDTLDLFRPIFENTGYLPRRDSELQEEEMQYEARMEAQEYEKDNLFEILNLQDND